MNDALDHYIDRLEVLLERISPAERTKLGRRIGNEIRQSNRMRIIANLQPDGNPMRRRKGNKDFLNGYRKLRDNENVKIGQPFIYDGPEMRHQNVGELREMITIKTAAHDKKYGFPYRKHKGGGWYQRSPYDPDYVQGFALSRGGSLGQDGVSKFNRKYIYVLGQERISVLKQKLMFRKIHQFKYLKMKADSHGTAVGFMTGLTGYIAAAHQYGEDNRPERPLLGFSDEDLNLIEAMIWQHVQP